MSWGKGPCGLSGEGSRTVNVCLRVSVCLGRMVLVRPWECVGDRTSVVGVRSMQSKRAWRSGDLTLGLMLACHPLEILNNF